jgi:hypothetical protein
MGGTSRGSFSLRRLGTREFVSSVMVSVVIMVAIALISLYFDVVTLDASHLINLGGNV